MLSTLFEILSMFFEPFKKLITRLWQRIRVWNFHRRTKSPALDESRAKEIAYLVLAKKINKAHAYRNIDSKRSYIVCLYHPERESNFVNVCILEEIGKSYQVLWNSKDTIYDLIDNFEVLDLDNNGIFEIVL